ncbi:AarF/UbiB family protein [Phycicoccus flavus]|uniref:AarF/UbiB family protein n=1 Tax=Phycicoccus flavus TaxID=2502783 RepID=UPI000FEBC9FE|nr:AarF/UbiB family protein [Phycicoccus flavus]NHA69044.1 AarF/ABC1/UbiB kinase family protein [Phycicoccus flavus]
MGVARTIGRATGRALDLLGPGYAKAGQILSTRKDILPAEICAGVADAVVRAGDGCGSVARVTREVRPGTGTPYARKTLRPGVRSSLERNLRTLRRGARLVARVPAARGIPVVEMTEDVSMSVASQTDLLRERESLHRLRSMVDAERVRVPEPLDDASSADNLAMEWLEADPRTALAVLDERDREETMTVLVQALLRMIFVHGFFHCDLHPGNWWPTAPGRIAIVDAGFMYELTPTDRWHFIEFFYGMAFGDGEHAFEHMVATAHPDMLPAPDRMAAFREDVVRLVEAQHDAPVDTFDLATFGAELFQVQRRHRFRGDTAFIFPLIALLSIEGQLKEFSPRLDFQEIARRELGRPLLDLRARFALADLRR